MKSTRIFSILFSFILANVSLWGKTFPLYFGFDSPPTFDPQYFTTYGNYQGQNGMVDIVNGDGALGTAYFVRLGKINDQVGTTINALDLKLNLSGYAGTQLEFSFWFRFFHDNTQFNDGVFMSDDGGVTFTRIIALEPEKWCNNAWGAFQTFDFDQLLEQSNLNFTSNFIIQFRHEGSGDFNTSGDEDGLMLDEIFIGEAPEIQPAPISLTEPFYEGFSTGQFEAYWTLK
ncbi:MAG: hypothetical protein AAB316_23370, partial [Bacteroidota bacterium]